MAVASAQKSHKSSYGGGSPKATYSAYQETPSHTQSYQGGSSYQAGHAGPAAYQGHATATAKPSYPLLVQDTRQLNHDGSINFQYAADNGLQQGETVDPDGTRRGFYSYIGADGKPLTVKYTAGKNGFVAEGAHLPMQPNVAAASQAKDEVPSKGHSSEGDYYSGGAPSHYSSAPRTPSYNSAPYTPSYDSGPSYNPPSPYHNGGGAFRGFAPAGPSHYQGAPQTQYSHSLPSHQGGARYQSYGGSPSYAASMHTASDPYNPVGPAGPYAGQFDLGNGGTFSINFEPGQSQEVGPQQYGGAASAPASYSERAAPSRQY